MRGLVGFPVALLASALAGCTERIEVPPGTEPATSSAAWSLLVGYAVDEHGLVDYDLLADNRGVLESYMAWIADNGPLSEAWQESAENKRLAFMFNAHNAAVVLGVLETKPERSIRDVRVGLHRAPGAGFMKGLEFRVDSAWRTIDKLRHQLTLARYQEPRAHMALYLAARGGPTLRVWTYDGVDAALEDATRRFVQSERGLRPTEPDGYAASSLFFEYEKDFLEWGDALTLCAWLSHYADGHARAWLVEHVEDCPLERFELDWTLDEQSRQSTVESRQ